MKERKKEDRMKISAEEKKRIMDQNLRFSKKIIDLDDQLKDGMPYARMKVIRDRIHMLEDAIFYNQEYLEGGVDNE
jgi:hypothetical protein